MKPAAFIGALRFETRNIVDKAYPKRISWNGVIFERCSGYDVCNDGSYVIRYRPENLSGNNLPDAIPLD